MPDFPETVDVLLPGSREPPQYKQAPDYEWERIGEVTGQLFRNTRGTGEIRLLLKNASDAERALIHSVAAVDLPPNTLWQHDYRGDYGVHTPGLTVTAAGTVVATAIRRHDSNSDGGHDGDIITARSAETHGRSWSEQSVAYSEPGVLICKRSAPFHKTSWK